MTMVDKMKKCLDCGVEFKQTGKNHKRCSSCATARARQAVLDWQSKYITQKPGVGKGGSTPFGELNPYFRHGRSIFGRWAKEKLVELNYKCERCGATIDTSVKGMWAGHHKDHDKTNNIKSNLEVLCKRCHQVEHECWNAFQGVNNGNR